MSLVIADKSFLKGCGHLSNDIDDYPDGVVIPVDKPWRWTSADVIRKIKYQAIRHFGKKNLKVGHAGTLDPLATGVLLVCIGKATRKAEEFQRSDKEYVASVAFGATTPSYDREKGIDRFYPWSHITPEAVSEVLPQFKGTSEQVAPLFSAKSIDGVRAYEMARRMYRDSLRQGIPFDQDAAGILSRQKITISGIELLDWTPGTGGERIGAAPSPATAPAGNGHGNGPGNRINVTDNSALGLPQARIRVRCSKGTYIRALARDLGEALDSGAYLESLRRTACGSFTADEALSLGQALELLSKEHTEMTDTHLGEYTGRDYLVGGHRFSIFLGKPWNFMEYTPEVAARIGRASKGETLDSEPVRAGDEVPHRTLFQRPEELPVQRDRFSMDLSQFEPFRTGSEAEPLFAIYMHNTPLPEEDAPGTLVMDVTEDPPFYTVTEYEGKTVYVYRTPEGKTIGGLVVSENGSRGDYYPCNDIRPSYTAQQLCTATMVLFTGAASTKDTLLVHASTVRHEGQANVFFGTSGTGKSTHSKLWLNNIPQTDLLNDDNPVLRVEDGQVFVYGSPWSGKTPCYRNVKVPVRAIVKLRQAKQNSISRVEGLQAYADIMSSSSCLRWRKDLEKGVSDTCEKIAMSAVSFWHLDCLPDPDAAFTCLKGIEG